MQQLHPTKLLLGLLAAPIAAGSAWLCAAVAKYGVHLDPSGINTLATAGAAGALAVIVKLIHDVGRQHPTLASDAKTLERAALKADPQLADALNTAWPPPTPPRATGAPQDAPQAPQTAWTPGG